MEAELLEQHSLTMQIARRHIAVVQMGAMDEASRQQTDLMLEPYCASAKNGTVRATAMRGSHPLCDLGSGTGL